MFGVDFLLAETDSLCKACARVGGTQGLQHTEPCRAMDRAGFRRQSVTAWDVGDPKQLFRLRLSYKKDVGEDIIQTASHAGPGGTLNGEKRMIIDFPADPTFVYCSPAISMLSLSLDVKRKAG